MNPQAVQLGYWVDLASAKLSDEPEPACWLQAFPYGTWQHPLYGEMKFDQDRATRFATNVKNKVRKSDLDIDYDHKERDGKAAGWVRDAEVRQDGLYLNVAWTPDAARMIKNKEYRYFSPEFNDEWTDPATQTKYTDVLFGGALTNRPFLRGIAPVNLSEVLPEREEEPPVAKIADAMKPIAKAIGLAEDVDESEFVTKLSERLTKPADPPPKDDDKKARLKKLKESDPEAAKMLKEAWERAEQNEKELATLTVKSLTEGAATKLSEVKGEKGILPPAVKDKLLPVAVALNETNQKTLFEALEQLAKTGLVQLGEQGRNDSGSGRTGAEPGNEGGQHVFMEKVEEARKANDKLSAADAIVKVANENPDLYRAYRTEFLKSSTQVV